jgi:hypothetical protein
LEVTYELLVWELTLPLDLGATLKGHEKRRKFAPY